MLPLYPNLPPRSDHLGREGMIICNLFHLFAPYMIGRKLLEIGATKIR